MKTTGLMFLSAGIRSRNTVQTLYRGSTSIFSEFCEYVSKLRRNFQTICKVHPLAEGIKPIRGVKFVTKRLLLKYVCQRRNQCYISRWYKNFVLNHPVFYPENVEKCWMYLVRRGLTELVSKLGAIGIYTL